ncbi:12557_t:CDS:2, partial [Entrophospora sp. SA101]
HSSIANILSLWVKPVLLEEVSKDHHFYTTRMILLESNPFNELKENIKRNLLHPNHPGFINIISYGVGCIEKSIVSQYQFALLLLLKDLFQV